LKILILSDLHIDMAEMPVVVDGRRIDADADVVVLAGDIEEGLRSPDWARKTFPSKEIILIAGNHEFYGRYWNRNLSRLRQRSKDLGIRFLENDATEIGDVRFLGCTLWTDFMVNGSSRRQMAVEARQRMTDFRKIKHDRRAGEDHEWKLFETPMLHPEATVKRHLASVEWLERQLNACSAHKIVVVTHHAPHPQSIPPHQQNNALAPAYASNLDDLMGQCTLWIHGHIHHGADYEVRGTRVVCNPRGYAYARDEGRNPGFNPFFMVEV
jgi:predicted phosphodiesterase